VQLLVKEQHLMTDVVIAGADTVAVARQKPSGPEDSGVDAELVARPVEQARTAGLQLTGEDGLLQIVRKRRRRLSGVEDMVIRCPPRV
jgi:hypothetical protein